MYSWGAGTSGQLGVSQANDVLRPQSVDPQLALPEQVSCGGHTSIFLKGGLVYACGTMKGMSATPEVQQEPLLIPQRMQLPSWLHARVIQMAAGWDHAAFVTETGLAFTAGDGRSGQLGLGPTCLRVQEPELLADVAASWQVTQVACGMHHTLLLATSRSQDASTKNDLSILGCGGQKHGQLGLMPLGLEADAGLKRRPPVHPQWTPRTLDIPAGPRTLQVAAGGHQSAVLHSSGTGCLLWGKGIGVSSPKGTCVEISALLMPPSGHLLGAAPLL
ncbi:hypothetical protein WJX84_010256 [Apatococcus fuscideae]|uniref:Secretion-regulating guanine nucleotide exchange factor n=1 Tax=Apatococcus fuscideae TaxID=2026836 RepID=A0AAW1RKG7_9CHLO